MYDNRVIYIYEREEGIRILFSKWYFAGDDPIERNRTYKNLTASTIDRIERIIQKAKASYPNLNYNRIFLPYWFYGKIYLD